MLLSRAWRIERFKEVQSVLTAHQGDWKVSHVKQIHPLMTNGKKNPEK